MAKAGSSEVATRTVPQSECDTTPSSLERPPASRMTTPPRGRMRTLGMVVVALVGLLLGIGLGGTYLSESSASPPRVALQPSAMLDGPTHAAHDAPFELDASSAAALPPAPTVAPPELTAPPTPSPATSDPLPRTRARDAATAKPKAKVEFAAHQFFFVWVKVGSRTLALEPTATLELPPGRHTVQLRERPTDPWIDAGRIRVEAGQRYRVKLRKPAGLTLEAL